MTRRPVRRQSRLERLLLRWTAAAVAWRVLALLTVLAGAAWLIEAVWLH